jgi:hypothetical protein
MTLIRLALALVVVVVAPATPAHPQDQSQRVVVGHYPPRPATIEELAKQVPLIVRARIREAGTEPIITSLGVVVYHMHDIDVEEVLKGDTALAGRTIRVAQAGGTARLQGKSHVTAYDMRLLKNGSEEILFLIPWHSQSCYLIAFGPAGAYPTADGIVTLPRASRGMGPFREQSSTTLATFRESIGAERRRTR